MTRYIKRQEVEYTGELTSELLGGTGVILDVMRENGHLVYVVKITTPPLAGIAKVGVTLKVSGTDITLRRRYSA